MAGRDGHRGEVSHEGVALIDGSGKVATGTNTADDVASKGTIGETEAIGLPLQGQQRTMIVGVPPVPSCCHCDPVTLQVRVYVPSDAAASRTIVHNGDDNRLASIHAAAAIRCPDEEDELDEDRGRRTRRANSPRTMTNCCSTNCCSTLLLTTRTRMKTRRRRR